ncbi:MAG TPA: SurA N-terminal domain-containing protein, partial [Deltaproteobacteria bacterium]|nr:SurA N-terminal domain-containing protein [Deltaproteobacteria bacterium]
MLTYMRTRSKKWVRWIIFGAIIIVFVFWGGSTYLTRESSKIAKIDRYIITQQQYAKAYEDALSMYQSQLGNALTPDMIKQLDLKNKVLDQMIDEYVLDYEAKKLGITVSDEELQMAIRNFPPFQEDGQFSPENYRRVLAYQRLTPAQFEDMQRKEVLKQRIYALIAENVVVSPAEVSSLYKYQNDVFNLSYVTIDAQAYEKDMNVSDQEAAAFYDANKERYKIPPKIALTYILFPSVNYTKDVTVTPDDVKGYYDSHKDEFIQ